MRQYSGLFEAVGIILLVIGAMLFFMTKWMSWGALAYSGYGVFIVGIICVISAKYLSGESERE